MQQNEIFFGSVEYTLTEWKYRAISNITKLGKQF